MSGEGLLRKTRCSWAGLSKVCARVQLKRQRAASHLKSSYFLQRVSHLASSSTLLCVSHSARSSTLVVQWPRAAVGRSTRDQSQLRFTQLTLWVPACKL